MSFVDRINIQILKIMISSSFLFFIIYRPTSLCSVPVHLFTIDCLFQSFNVKSCLLWNVIDLDCFPILWFKICKISWKCSLFIWQYVSSYIGNLQFIFPWMYWELQSLVCFVAFCSLDLDHYQLKTGWQFDSSYYHILLIDHLLCQ